MADNQTQRPYRAPAGSGRNPPASGSDPLAELARLIGQNDPFAEFGREGAHGAAAAAPPTQPPPAEPYPAEPGAYQAPHDYQAQPEAHPSYAAEDLYPTGTAAPGYAPHPDAAGYEPPYDDPNLPPYEADEHDYYDDVPPRRRMGILAIAAVFALAVIGTAGAFGYRALFGTSNAGPPPIIKADSTPSKIVPPKKDSLAKLIQDRAPPQEKLVPREEKPVDIQDKPAGVFPQNQPGAGGEAMQTPTPGSGVVGGEPKTVHTIVIRPDQLNSANNGKAGLGASPPATITPIEPANVSPAAPPSRQVASAPPAAEQPAPAPVPVPKPAPRQPVVHAAPAPRHPVARTRPAPQHHYRTAAVEPVARNAPLSLSPDASPPPPAAARSAPRRIASAPRQIEPQASPVTHAGGHYAVQVSSRRSRADAEAAFRSLQARYPGQLGSHQPMIRRVDLGQKGVYYRAMVGPFANHDAASRLCNSLKAAGGSCFIQRI